MQIVQLSDIHIGGLFKQDAFDIVVNEIRELKPDVIVITGDLTDEGLVLEFERAKLEVNRLDCANTIVLPGNHDYRHTGYLPFKKFFPSSPTHVHEFEDAVIIILGTARPDRDEGEVGYRQNLWIEKTLSHYKNKLKIVAMHHHLIGIPDTGTDKIIILDAGDTLRACLQSKVDLVLCGHKHRPWVWNLGPLEIAYAGTASSARFRGFFENSYNIITTENGKASVDIKIVGGKRFRLSDLVQKYKPYSETI
ncbi:MAG TPA: metallophosphoesterase [Nitrososphaeraceae archaeon]|jgi:3',5'-cyclic AMP phosphodiesterase CpdA|nr:metallophosphoesterase [Nitrososphaeraceae archaeon]